MTLKWKNLETNHCPKCGSTIKANNKFVQCANKKCGFSIRHDRLLELKDRLGIENVKRSNEFEGYGFD